MTELFQEVRKNIFGKWLNIPGILRDRQKIIADPTVTIRQPNSFENKPYQFATQVMLLPAVLISSISAMISFFITPPPLSIERETSYQIKIASLLGRFSEEFREKKTRDELIKLPYKNLSESQFQALYKARFDRLESLAKQRKSNESSPEFEQAKKEYLEILPVWIARTNEELGLLTDKASAEANSNQALLKSITKLTALEAQYCWLTIGITLLINSLIFKKMIRRKFVNEDWTEGIQGAYLYIVPASIAPVVVLISIANILLDYSLRYDAFWYLKIHNPLPILLALLGLFQIYIAARRPQSVHDRAVVFQVAGRLFLSNILTGIAVNVAIAAAGTGIFYFIYLRSL
jgi:hypothetical protein